jgi:hypothetical protein
MIMRAVGGTRLSYHETRHEQRRAAPANSTSVRLEAPASVSTIDVSTVLESVDLIVPMEVEVEMEMEVTAI